MWLAEVAVSASITRDLPNGFLLLVSFLVWHMNPLRWMIKELTDKGH